ncbi:MAG: alpha/beta hydrolase [Bryobacteraceae bacterium]|jgi:pimeloyl-ACP methyl ester carboxylesterase
MLNRTTTSFDGVPIAYTVSGTADTALVFVHGGMADRSFWDGQHAAFADRFRVVALDLAGHGESGQNRREWGIPQFGRDVAAAMDAERVPRAVLIGNSLGGPAVIEAALLTGTRTLAVIGVDSFQDMGQTMDLNRMHEMAEAWRRDSHGMLDQMLRMLLYPDTAPSLVEDVRRRMSRMPLDAVCAMFRCFGGYDTGVPARQLRMPVRCINGDRFPTDVEAIRRVIGDFDAVVLTHTGHFPMLECPEEFNRRLEETLQGLAIA